MGKSSQSRDTLCSLRHLATCVGFTAEVLWLMQLKHIGQNMRALHLMALHYLG